MKPFKTHNQQLKILRGRNLNLNQASKRHLENENYYNVINGYKDLFLKRNIDGTLVDPEEYKDGCHLDEIYSLFKIDRKMRNTLLEYTLIFETSIKSRIAYYFSEKYPEPHSYLYFKNYSDNPRKTKSILELISNLSYVMKNDKNKPVKHYLNTHQEVPLWVLINYLTIGNVNYMYGCLDDDLRTIIAKDFKSKLEREYKRVNVNITPKDLDSMLQQVNLFRNVCAHEERLYDFKIIKAKPLSNILNTHKVISNHEPNFDSDVRDANLFNFIVCLKVFLSKKDYNRLCKELDSSIEYYKNKFLTISIKDIYQIIGSNGLIFADLIK